jgi:hypothetical protein
MTQIHGRPRAPQTPAERPRAAAPAEVPGGRRRAAVADGLDAATRGGNAARPRAQTNGKVKSAMSGLKRAGLVALSAAVLVGAAFVAQDRLAEGPSPDPAPVVVPVERPEAQDGPSLPPPGDVAPLEETPSGPGGETEPPPGLPGGGPSPGAPASPTDGEAASDTPGTGSRPAGPAERDDAPGLPGRGRGPSGAAEGDSASGAPGRPPRSAAENPAEAPPAEARVDPAPERRPQDVQPPADRPPSPDTAREVETRPEPLTFRPWERPNLHLPSRGRGGDGS